MPIPEAVRRMAVPSVISQLVVLLYNLADTFYIGQTNDPSMVAGVSLILPVFNVTIALGVLIGTGGGAFIPKLLGLDRLREAERVNRFCMGLTVAVTGLFCLILLIFSGPFLRLLGADANTFAYARLYMLIVVVGGGIPTVLTNVLSSLLRSFGLSKEAGTGVALGGLLNIALDPLFMFVILPRGQEVLGVSVATILSNIIACLYCLFIMLHRQNVLTVHVRDTLPEKASVAAVFVVGIPAAMNVFLFDLDYMILNRLMSGYGHIAVAAIGIVLKAMRFPIQAGIGLCQGMIPLIAYSYTARHYERMKNIVRFCLKTGFLICAGSIILYELAAPLIIRLFIREAETVAYGTVFLRAQALATVFMFMSFFIVHVFQGLGMGRHALALCVMRWAAFNIPMLFLLNHLFGRMGLVWAQVAADILTVTVSLIVYKKAVEKMV